MWDERYSLAEYAYGTQPNDFLREVAPRLPQGRALCLAEGEGRNAVFLAQCGLEVVAVDQSAVGLEKAQRLAASRQAVLQTVVANLDSYAIGDNAWDVIVSIWAHVPPALRQQVHRACVTGLKPGGMFVLEAYTPAQLAFKTGGPPVPELTMTLAALQHELSGLDFLIGRELVREVREGRYHDGQSAVVQVLARRGGGPSADPGAGTLGR